MEAYIDFSEDENIEKDVLDQVKASVQDLQKQIQVRRNPYSELPTMAPFLMVVHFF